MRRWQHCPIRMIWWKSLSSAIRGRRSASAATAVSSLSATAPRCVGLLLRPHQRCARCANDSGSAPRTRIGIAGCGIWRLPVWCKGPCLVYLRDGVDVVSRPVPILQPGAPDAYAGVLISALMKAEYEERQHAVIDALARLGRGEAGADDLNWLRDAATNLNGLPASALDGLKLLPSSAETLIRLLLSARDAEERGTIWALQNELPFLWLALPLRSWLSAMERQCTALTSALETVLGRERAMNEAVAWLRGVCGDLTALEPALETIFVMAGLPSVQTTDIPSLHDLTSELHPRPAPAGRRCAQRSRGAPRLRGSEASARNRNEIAHGFCGPLCPRPARRKCPGETRARPRTWR